MTVLNVHFRVCPITASHLLSMYNLYNKENLNLRDLRTLTVCIYAGFLRFSEVSVPKRDHIDIQDAYIYRSGHWIYISRLNSVLCPVKINQKYI